MYYGTRPGEWRIWHSKSWGFLISLEVAKWERENPRVARIANAHLGPAILGNLGVIPHETVDPLAIAESLYHPYFLGKEPAYILPDVPEECSSFSQPSP